MHDAKPEAADLSEWTKWAEEQDPDGESGFVWETPLVSIPYVEKLVQQVREMKLDTEGFIEKLRYPDEDTDD